MAKLKLTIATILVGITYCISAVASDPFSDIYGESNFISIASGSKKALREAPAIASIITQEDILTSNARTLEDILEKIAGIHVSVAHAGYTPIYHIRGIGSDFNRQALTLINNVPITHIFNGDQGTTWSHMPLSAIERIEIIRGPGSVLYGADAYTGVINIITKNAASITPTASVTLASQDTYTLAAQTNFTFEHWDGSLTFEAGGTNGFDAFIESDLQSLNDSLTNTNASNTPGSVHAAKDWAEIWGSLSNENWDIRFGYQGRYNVEQIAGWFGSLDNEGALKGERMYLHGTTSQDIHDSMILDQTFAFQGAKYSGLIYLSPQGNFNYPKGLIGGAWYKEVHARYNSVLIHELNNKHSMRYGINTFIGRLFDISERRNYFSNFAPIPNNEIRKFTQDSSEIFLKNVTRKNIGLYIQDEYTPNDTSTFTVGARYDYYTDFGGTFNPRIAWVNKLNPIITSKFLFGKAFRAPSIFELYAINNPIRRGNPNLTPDKITTFEASLHFAFSGQDFISLNAYKNIRKDIIIFNQKSGQYENAGGQEGIGLEIEYSKDMTNLWTLSGNIAISRNNDNINHAQEAAVPQRQIFLNNLWRLTPEHTLGLESFYIADRARKQDDNRSMSKNTVLFNITSIYEPIEKNFTIKAGIKNLLNKFNVEPSTFSPVQTPGLYFPENDLPHPERSFYIEISQQL